MNDYIEHLLQLYKEKKLSHEAALSLLEKYKALNDKEKPSEPIAIIGLSCKMPMAPSKEAFWEQLIRGTNCVTEFPEERRKDTDWLIPILGDQLRSNEKPYWKGGFLTEVDRFDNDFFHIVPSEAKIMDPQQRIFLELAHAAFEDAGYTSDQLRGSNTGVFIGDVVNEYRKLISEASPLAVIGNISPFIASRVSHFYDLHGPALNVSTTCSTSLIAVHLACQSLLSFECDLAITGAVNLRLFPFAIKEDPIDALGITTDKGACLAFDDQASGIVRGEGAGALVLKRFSDAIRDRNPIYALIRGSATNNDGKSSSVGAPNPLAQASLLKTAWEKGRIDPRHIDYIETHGTGTRIGDPIEIQGITKAISAFTEDKQFCAIGSVKTNIGHLTGGASGLASLLKTILALKNNQIPPSLHFKEPNSFIDFPNTPVFVANRPLSWPPKSHPRLAGISAFGFNGSNCHIVIEEAPNRSRPIEISTKKLPFLFSHRNLTGLERQLKVYLAFFRNIPLEIRVEDISYTLAKGRNHYPVQSLFMASSVGELIKDIELALSNGLKLDPIPKMNFDEIFQGLSPILVSLPSYVFEQKRFWLESKSWSDEDRIAPPVALKEKEVLSVQEQLLRLFGEVLGVDSIDSSDNFFDLGGDSLAGMEIINSIHKKLEKKISYQDLFNNPRVIDLSLFLEGKDRSFFQPIPRHAIQEFCPLSYGQRRLWILHQMQDHPIAYNIHDTYHFETLLDLRAFRNALNLLVQRHTDLHTVFLQKDGEPYQKLIDPQPFDLTVLKASSIDDAKGQIASLRNQPFDLEKGPLAKALLLQLSPTSSLFFFMIHHIIADGWSIRIIIEELLKLYTGNINLEQIRINSIDYCHWQRELFLSEKFKAMESYWLKELAAPVPVCEIPGDKTRPAVFHFEGARKTFRLSRPEQTALTRIGSGAGGTLFMVLLSSVYTLIYRYTGQTDLIVGSPVSGRSHADLKSLIGFFVNTLAIRCCLNPNGNFKELFLQVKGKVLEAMENQDYPFDHLIDCLKLERDTSRSPLFNINVAFQNFELDSKAEGALKQMQAKRVDLPHQSCKWDLEFEFVTEADGSIECFVEYYVGIYSDSMIELLITTYRSLLQSIIEDTDQPLHQLKLSPVSYNIFGPDHDLKETLLHQLFENQVECSRSLPAIQIGSRAMTYEELNKKANQLAHYLKFEKNLKPETLVGIYLENSEESILSILAILKAGGAFVPLDIKAPIQRIVSMVKEGKIEHLLSKKQYIKSLDNLLWSVPLLRSYICLDVEWIDEVIKSSSSDLMNVDLWNQVAIESTDEISSSGWVSSYTGLPFSEEEMKEYSENILQKLKIHLRPSFRVLEIGCGSGLTAFSLASHVQEYVGIDLSSEIVKKNQERARKEHLTHLKFICGKADQIDTLEMGHFDLIILNSVIHCFPNLPYLKLVIRKAIDLCNEKAFIFLGDLMDLALKTEMEDRLRSFKESHQDPSFRTKVDWSQELFISKDYLLDLRGDIPGIEQFEFSRKRGSLENELTQFRFDALIKINRIQKTLLPKQKEQHGWASIHNQPDSNLNLFFSDQSLAYVLFTSGSTGKPKGVMVEHRSMHNYIAWAKRDYGKDRFPFYSPLHFDLTMTSVFIPLLYGGCVQIFEGEFDEVLESLSNNDSCNTLKLTPAHLTMIIDRGEPIPSIRHFIVGGESLYAPQVVALSQLYREPIRVDNEYGPTEATVGCITHTWTPSEKEGALLIGRPIANAHIHIVDANLHPVPIGGIGEILIGGTGLARGYLNNIDLTAQKFIPDPLSGRRIYRTGDLGRYLPSGEIVYLGRKDRQVKIKGYRIELDEIEAQILRHPLVLNCAVVIKNDPQRGKFLCGYYTSGKSLSSEELSQFLSMFLPLYMIPHLVLLSVMPMTGNGKIDTSKLPELHGGNSKQRIPPKTDGERVLVNIWSRVLGLLETELSTDDDFFDLGGDSIMAMRIIPQVRAAGFNLSIKEIFQHRTISSLSQKISFHPPSCIDQKMVEGQVPWTPIQHWFWEQEMAEPTYFNMAYLFRVPTQLHSERLEQAFWKCFEHHDALRSFFTGEQQRISSLNSLVFRIEEFALGHLNEEEQKQEIIRLSTQLQSHFDLAKPPLLKAAIFDLGHHGKRLFLAIHHLIIDGVSWRYLVEDLASLYHSEALPLKTHSFKDWAESLSWQKNVEIDPWIEMDPSQFPRLSVGPFPLFAETLEEYVRFTEEETSALLALSSRANISEILLTALSESLFDVFGFEKCLIDHEGHGRNGELDVSRTIGWFTTIYPICLERKATPSETLSKIQEMVRKISRHDISYGIGRYLQKHPHLQRFKPEILLNYFGRVDADLNTQGGKEFLSNCNEEIGRTIHPANRMPHLVEMNAIIIENRLRIAILYNPASFSLGTADHWFAAFRQQVIQQTNVYQKG